MKPEKKQQMKPLNTMKQTVAKAQKELSQLEAKKVKSPQKRKEKASFQNTPPVEIFLDSLEFNPVTENDCAWVMANVPMGISGIKMVSLSHRNSSNIDCGFSVKIPDGYKLVVELLSHFKDRGLEIYNNVLTGESRLSFNVRNVGREIVVVNNRDRVAFLRIEPIYPLTFKLVKEF